MVWLFLSKLIRLESSQILAVLFNDLTAVLIRALPESASMIDIISDTISFMLLAYFAIAILSIALSIMKDSRR